MSFWQDIIGFFFKETPEQKLAKQINVLLKSLRLMKPSVVESKSDWLAPAFIAHLHEIFQPILGFLALLKIEMLDKKGTSVRRFLLESITTDEQKKQLEMLQEKELVDSIQNMNKKDFYLMVENVLKTFMDGYTNEGKAGINMTYNRLHAFATLGEYDFKMFFTDFDSSFNADNPNYVPRFTSKDGKYFLDDFKQLDKTIHSVIFDDQLVEDFALFLKGLGKPVPDLKKIRASFKKLEALKERAALELFIQAVSKNLDYHSESPVYNDNIVIGLLDQIVREKKAVIDATYAKMKDANLAQLQSQLFGGETTAPLRHYTPRNNQAFQQNGVAIFEFTAELDLVKSFLILKYNKTFKDFINNLIIRGKFKDSESQKLLNDSYYRLNEILTQVTAFDESLSEAGKTGQRIKVLFLSMKKDKKAAMALNDLVEEVNKEAKGVIGEMIVHIKNIYTIFQAIDATYHEQSKKLMLNILDFDGGKTSASVTRIKGFGQEIVLFLNTLKSLSK